MFTKWHEFAKVACLRPCSSSPLTRSRCTGFVPPSLSSLRRKISLINFQFPHFDRARDSILPHVKSNIIRNGISVSAPHCSRLFGIAQATRSQNIPILSKLWDNKFAAYQRPVGECVAQHPKIKNFIFSFDLHTPNAREWVAWISSVRSFVSADAYAIEIPISSMLNNGRASAHTFCICHLRYTVRSRPAIVCAARCTRAESTRRQRCVSPTCTKCY